jgi:NADH-quinone oxidoreductase subunit J
MLTLFSLAVLYLQLSAQFIAVMQVLVYAGAILVIFMFVIVLFQDAHRQIEKNEARSAPFLIGSALIGMAGVMFYVGRNLIGIRPQVETLPQGYGTVEGLGRALYIDFFFPFEAVIIIFLIALVGALYVGRKAT